MPTFGRCIYMTFNSWSKKPSISFAIHIFQLMALRNAMAVYIYQRALSDLHSDNQFITVPSLCQLVVGKAYRSWSVSLQLAESIVSSSPNSPLSPSQLTTPHPPLHPSPVSSSHAPSSTPSSSYSSPKAYVSRVKTICPSNRIGNGCRIHCLARHSNGGEWIIL